MIGTMLERSLQVVARRLQKLRVLRRQSLCWLVLMIPAVIICLWMPAAAGFLRTEFVVVLAATVAGVLLSRLLVRWPSNVETARLIEQRYPELNDAVLTAVRVQETPGGAKSVLSRMVISDADRLARQADWTRAVPGRQMLIWSVISLLTFVMMVSGVMAASRWGRNLRFSNLLSPLEQSAERMQQIGAELVVEPGDVEIEHGTALTAVARFSTTLPLQVMLEFSSADGQMRQLAMAPTVDDGVFAARMEQILSDGTYRVRFGDRNPDDPRTDIDLAGASDEFRVSTFIRPAVEQIDVLVTPPEYTGREAQLIEDTLRVVAVEGSALKLRLKLNKAVELIELRAKDGGALVLPTSAEDRLTAEISLLATQNQSWSVYLQDSAGRTAADEPVFSVRITQNGRPQLKVTFPGRDTNVSAIQEFAIEAEAVDDFGLVDYGVQYAITGNEEQIVSLAEVKNSDADSNSESVTTVSPLPVKVKMPHVIDLESLRSQPDDLVTYYFYADDIGPDGAVRRTYSDMMFAEVRRFEEIFREAQQNSEQQQQQQQQQEQGQQSPVDGVLQLQKEIISATWNTLRTESERRQAGTLKQDVTVIAESQAAAIEQLAELQERVGDEEKLVALGEAAAAEMNKALERLGQYRDQQVGASLSSALLPEQAAYQTLMKMRAAEFQVRQQQQQQGQQGQGQGQNSASQQQLQQLELDNSRNRYESERQAQQQQQMTEQQRNQLQVLNRLKELARRQQMLNERMKQLESELRAATTDSQREEIEQQLKRLRDEQREMLRDVDELRDRVDQAGSQQQPQDAPMREQIEQARSNVQQAARAMDEGRLSEAIAEGTRAERQFEQLKNEFRDQTSSRFTDAMRDLREQAQELSEQQQELRRRLSGESARENPENDGTAEQRPSLRADRNREELEKQAGAQLDRLQRVMDEANRIVEQAEESEPLLSTRLYDAMREARESKVKEAVEATEMLAGRGLWAQSQRAEEIARDGIERLRQSVDKAADAVLGSEADAMRRAQSELQELSQQLAQEVRNATGEPESGLSTQDGEQSDRNTAYDRQDRQSPGGQEQQGAQEQGDQQPGGQQPGGQQPGGQQPGGQQPGEQQQGGQQQRDQQQSGQQGDQQSREQQESGQQQAGGQQAGGQQSGGQPSDRRPGDQQQSILRAGGRQEGQGGGADGGNAAQAQPLTGEDFTRWSDRLRDVEEMLEDPELRNQVARARDRARAIRAEFKRHGQEPQWDLVKSGVLSELQSLQSRIAEELLRLESNRSMVPIDREPVPEEFDSLVQRYYELLGQQRQKEPLN